MNQMDDLMHMAREAGYQHPDAVGACEDFAYFDIERFAQLVAKKAVEAAKAEERANIINLMMIQHEAAAGRHNYWAVAANLIEAERR